MSHWDQKHAEVGDSKVDDFESEVSNTVRQVNFKGSRFFLCCIDGSSQSEEAFQSAMNIRRKYDHLCVFHAYRGDSNEFNCYPYFS